MSRSAGDDLGLSASLGNGATIGAWVGSGGEALAAVLAGERARDIEGHWMWRITAVGGERRAAASAWASAVGATEHASLREVARAASHAVLVLGQRAPSIDELRLLGEGDRRVILLAAPPLAEACALDRDGDQIRVVPSLRLSESLRAASPMVSELREAAGDQVGISAMSIRLRCAPGERTVDGLLLEACELIAAEFAAIESVVAMARPPLTGGEVRTLVALVRDSAGRIGTIDCADAGGWSREIEWLGPGGRIRIDDGIVRRWSPTGSAIERLDVHAPRDAIEAAIESLRSLALTRFPREEPGCLVEALAAAEAAKLSARTGNPESPSRMHELLAKP